MVGSCVVQIDKTARTCTQLCVPTLFFFSFDDSTCAKAAYAVSVMKRTEEKTKKKYYIFFICTKTRPSTKRTEKIQNQNNIIQICFTNFFFRLRFFLSLSLSTFRLLFAWILFIVHRRRRNFVTA